MEKAKKIIALSASLLLLLAAIFLLFQIISLTYFVILAILILIVVLLANYIVPVFKKDLETGDIISRNPVLFTTKSVFPFQFFPDRYIVQEKNFYIVRKTFFSTGWTEMLPIKDIASVRMYSGPFFASITILRKVLPLTSFELRDLWKKDAFKLKEILDGLIMKEAKLINIPQMISSDDKTEMLIRKTGGEDVEKEM